MCKQFTYLMAIILLPVVSSNLPAQNNIEKPEQNPFSQPDFLKYTPPVIPREKPVEITTDEAAEIDDVMPEFSLSATFISVNGPMAVVNDILLSIGDEIEGIRLIMVGEARVKIRYKGKVVDIELQEMNQDKILKSRRNGVK